MRNVHVAIMTPSFHVTDFDIEKTVFGGDTSKVGDVNEVRTECIVL